MKTILAAIDLSPVSSDVCATALGLAKSLRARVVLLHCIEPQYLPDDLGLMSEYLVTFADAAERAARRNLAARRRRLASADVDVETRCVRGFAAAAILEEAGRSDADWIIVGSHGHTAIYDLFVGSTAHRVLMGSKRPVVVVPAARSGRSGDKKCTSPAK
jgi:nucleotide-binding universal stress UspA family protein